MKRDHNKKHIVYIMQVYISNPYFTIHSIRTTSGILRVQKMSVVGALPAQEEAQLGEDSWYKETLPCETDSDWDDKGDVNFKKDPLSEEV